MFPLKYWFDEQLQIPFEQFKPIWSLQGVDIEQYSLLFNLLARIFLILENKHELKEIILSTTIFVAFIPIKASIHAFTGVFNTNKTLFYIALNIRQTFWTLKQTLR